MHDADDLTHAIDQQAIWTRRVEQIRREQQPRRTPSTGLPPVCDAAAAMKIDPPGSVAAPHAVVTENPQDRPIPAIKLARIVMSVAEQAAMGDGMSLADALSMLARDIAHPLRLGEHG